VNRHHWQCGYHADQYGFECCCGLTGERHWICDALPSDRAPTVEEYHAYLVESARRRAMAPPPEHEALAEQFAWTEAGE
jgi:hypothetical protein